MPASRHRAPSRRRRPSPPWRAGRYPPACSSLAHARCRWRAAMSTPARSWRCARTPSRAGVMTPSQPPDHTIGMLVMSASPRRAELEQHAAERLVGENAGEVVDPAIAFGLADHGDHLVGVELARRDPVLEPARVLHASSVRFSRLRSPFSLSSLLGLPQAHARPRKLAAQHFLVTLPRSIIGAALLRCARSAARRLRRRRLVERATSAVPAPASTTP